MAPIFTGIARGLSGFGFGRPTVSAGGGVLSATGGTIYTPGNGYKYHVFTAPNADNFVVTNSGPGFVEVLVVGGGGCAGVGYNSGAGGGGVCIHRAYPIIATTYPVTVGGSKGAGVNATGNPSIFNNITALGGGGGATPSTPGGPGGSGGGGQESNLPVGSGIQPSQNAPLTPNPSFTQYGNPGGAGQLTGSYAAGGGGGAGGVGGTSPGPGSGGPGGPGIAVPGFEYSLIGLGPLSPVANSPTNNHYGAGGGGWGYSTQLGGLRPVGGGGRGGSDAPISDQSGLNNLGGGAGNNYYTSAPAKTGGSGIVVVRYLV